MYRMLVEIRTVKAILMKSRTELGNRLMETRGKAILVIKWQRTLMNCICVLVFVENRTYKQ